MNDTRMNWVTYFLPKPEQITVVLSAQIKTPAIQTLLNNCGGKKEANLTKQDNPSRHFTPLSTRQLERFGNNTIIYLTHCRESFESIRHKINSTSTYSVEEYSIFPGWNNPRWCIPRSRSLRPGKMSRMIQPSRLLAKIAVTIYRILKLFNSTHYLFPCRIIVVHKQLPSFLNFFSSLRGEIKTGIVYTGSFGPLQKYTVELLRDNHLFAYAKFGANKFSKKAIQNERTVLRRLSKLTFNNIITPELIEAPLPEILANRTIIIKRLVGGKPLQKITSVVVSSLAELFTTTVDANSTSINQYIDTLQKTLIELDCADLAHGFCKIRDDIISILDKMVMRYTDNAMLPLSLSHGDFTRWNIRADNKKIYAIDWEEANMRPPGHDLLSFLMAEYFLVKKTDTKQMIPQMVKEVTNGKTFNNFLRTIQSTEISPIIDNSLLGILFFSEVIRSNLWHLIMHGKNNYPEKESLDNLIRAAWLCSLQLS